MSTEVNFKGHYANYLYYDLDISGGIKAEAGNYIFAKFDGQFYIPLYVGIADDLNARLRGHDRLAEAIRLGATHVLAHTTPDARSQSDEEQDLIQTFNPVLNTQHRTGLAAAILYGH